MGIFMTDTQTTTFEVQFLLPKYVAKKLFITPNSEISTRKDSKNPETEWQKQQLFSKQHQKSFKS